MNLFSQTWFVRLEWSNSEILGQILRWTLLNELSNQQLFLFLWTKDYHLGWNVEIAIVAATGVCNYSDWWQTDRKTKTHSIWLQISSAGLPNFYWRVYHVARWQVLLCLFTGLIQYCHWCQDDVWFKLVQRTHSNNKILHILNDDQQNSIMLS